MFKRGKRSGSKLFYGFSWKLRSTRLVKKVLTLESPKMQGPGKHLEWSFFAKTVNGLKSLTIFAKKLHYRCLTES